MQCSGFFPANRRFRMSLCDGRSRLPSDKHRMFEKGFPYRQAAAQDVEAFGAVASKVPSDRHQYDICSSANQEQSSSASSTDCSSISNAAVNFVKVQCLP